MLVLLCLVVKEVVIFAAFCALHSWDEYMEDLIGGLALLMSQSCGIPQALRRLEHYSWFARFGNSQL